MSHTTHHRALNEQIASYNNQLDNGLRRRVGICLKTYKIIKNTTQLAGAAAGIYSMSLGADPMLTFTLIAAIILGPEGLEYALTNDPGGD